MKLQFIGTGSILSDRLSASALVDGKLLIDTPNGSMKAMRRAGLDISSVDICLFTHFHADHFFDIVFLFLEQGLVRPRDSELVLLGPAGLAERLGRLFDLAYPGTWPGIKDKVPPKFVEFGEEGGEWSGRGYSVRALPVQHTVPALGYHVTDEPGARLGYTGDTAHCPAVDRLASDSAVLVIDTTFPKQGKLGHMGLEEIESLADQWPDLRLLPTHLSDDVPGSSRPNIRFPSDGQRFSLDPSGSLTTIGP